MKTAKAAKRAKKAKPARRRRTVVVRDPAAPGKGGIEVAVPGDDPCTPSARAAAAAEAERHVETLDEHGRIARSAGPLTAGQTHAIEAGRGGRRKLVRKRFSAR